MGLPVLPNMDGWLIWPISMPLGCTPASKIDRAASQELQPWEMPSPGFPWRLGCLLQHQKLIGWVATVGNAFPWHPLASGPFSAASKITWICCTRGNNIPFAALGYLVTLPKSQRGVGLLITYINVYTYTV